MSSEYEIERNKPCKDRVKNSFISRMNDIRLLWKADNGELSEKQAEKVAYDIGELNEYGLCLDYVQPRTWKDQKYGYFRYQLSWGGPQEEFRYFPHVDRLEFWLLDWFDGAKVIVTGKNKVIILEIIKWVFPDLTPPPEEE